jgi:hypothetical protein
MSTSPESSFNFIFRFASITSRLIIIAISLNYKQI